MGKVHINVFLLQRVIIEEGSVKNIQAKSILVLVKLYSKCWCLKSIGKMTIKISQLLVKRAV